MNNTNTSFIDIRKTAESGQVFRANEIAPGVFAYAALDRAIVLKESDNSYDIVKDDPFWRTYFDFDTDYNAASRLAADYNDTFMVDACKAGNGIIILRQDPWEMLISFIISQRKSIPAIKTCIEKLCKKYGHEKHLFYDDRIDYTYYTFPTAEALNAAEIEDLNETGLGYRTEYIKAAARAVKEGLIDLEALKSSDDDELLNALKSVKGVGDKVANCIMLFAYHRTGRVPVDVWVSKIMEENYAGTNPFTKYGSFAGILQQYAFYYKRNIEKLINNQTI